MHFIENKCFSRNSLFEQPWYICITVLICITVFDNKQRECSDSISVAFNASSDDIISFETHFECVNRFQCKYFDVNASIALDYLSFCVNDFATTLSKWIESVGIGIGLKQVTKEKELEIEFDVDEIRMANGIKSEIKTRSTVAFKNPVYNRGKEGNRVIPGQSRLKV